MRGVGQLGVLAAVWFAAVVSGCRFQSQAPQDQKRAWQRPQANALAPAKLSSAAPAQWSRVQPLRVHAYAGPRYMERNPDWQSVIEEQLGRANDVLTPMLGVRLMLAQATPWSRQSGLNDIFALVDELAKLDAGQGTHFVIGYVGSDSSTLASFDEGGAARLFAKHLVVRSPESIQERQALMQGLDALDAEERHRLYQTRKRHKETIVLLHELGHVLGAIHARDVHWVMHSSYHHDMQAFSPANRELMKVVMETRLAAADDPEKVDMAAAVGRLLDVIDREGPQTWTNNDRNEVRELLAMARAKAQTSSAHAPGSADSTSGGGATPTAQGAGAPGPDPSGLSPEDQARYAELAQMLLSGGARAQFDAIKTLADRYPDAYPPQELLCKAAMSAGMYGSEVQAHCERMSELAR